MFHLSAQKSTESDKIDSYSPKWTDSTPGAQDDCTILPFFKGEFRLPVLPFFLALNQINYGSLSILFCLVTLQNISNIERISVIR